MTPAQVSRPLQWLIAQVAHPADRRFLLADLDEGFEMRQSTEGTAAARRWYRQQVFRSLPACLRDRWVRRRRGLVGDLFEDFRFAMRTLAKTPVVAVVTVLSLAIGLAAATTVFSVANAFLLRPASKAISNPEELVTVFQSQNDGTAYGVLSYPDIEDLFEQATSFVDVAAHRLGIVRIGPPESSRNVVVEIVTGNYFDVLGAQMQRGPGFTPDRTRYGAAERVVVISPRLWQDELGGKPDVIGSDLLLEGKLHQIVGVAPDGLIGRFLALRVDAWIPIGIPGGTFRSTERELTDRGEHNYGVVARLRDGVDMAAAGSELELIAARVAAEHPAAWSDEGSRTRFLTVLGEGAARARPDMVAALGAISSVVLLAAGLLLGIACANVAGVLLARADQRAPEIAVRLALGAGRRRLIAMLLTESLTLALAAGALGMLLTSWALDAFDSVTLPIGDVQMEFDLALDIRVMLFGLLLAVATSVAFGLAPALQASRTSVAPVLHGGGARGGTRVSRLRRILIVAQVATALIFVIGSAVALQSFSELTEVDWGVNPEGIAVMSHNAPVTVAEEDLPSHYRELTQRLQAHPEVQAARIGKVLEGSAFIIDASAIVTIPGYERGEGESMSYTYNAVSPGYIETLGVRIVQGRSFSARDDAAAPPVAIINEALARRFWPGKNVLGERFTVQTNAREAEVEIVGVAGDARYLGFEGSESAFMWLPLDQHPSRMYTLVLKGRGTAEEMVPILRAETDPADPEIQLIPPRTYDGLITYQFAFVRIMGQALAAAAAFGVLLATFGLYGVVSFSVSRRTREMAIRTAMGALPGQVIRLVLGDGLRLTAWGMGIGLLISVPLSAFMRARAGDIAPISVPSVIAGAALLSVAVAVAILVPARRASSIDPVVALRED